MKSRKCKLSLLAGLLAVILTGLSNGLSADSLFLNHSDKLVPAAGDPLMLFYLPGQSTARLGKYSKIMVDEPLVFIAEDSPYKGINLAKLNVITAAFRETIINALSDDFAIVEEPGKDVLLLRLALVDLEIKKKRFHILGYTPIGLVYRAGKETFESDYNRAVQHLSLLGLKIEGQLLDSQSVDVLAEFVNKRPGNRADPESWSALKKEMAHYGKVIDCMIVNSRSGPAGESDCVALLQKQALIPYDPGTLASLLYTPTPR